MNNLWILAAAGDEGEVVSSENVDAATEEFIAVDGSNGVAPGETAAPSRPAWMQFLPFIVIFVIMYMLLFRGPKKKQQKHTKMVQSLQKNDRVRTIGGMLGTVIDIKDDEITLKVDESNNTKIKVIAGAISKVVSGQDN